METKSHPCYRCIFQHGIHVDIPFDIHKKLFQTRYYLGEDGIRVSNAVMEIEGITYIFNQDGSVDENATAFISAFELK